MTFHLIGTMPLLWLLILLGGIFAEALFENFIVLPLSPPALGALIGMGFGLRPWQQAALFVLLSLIGNLVRLWLGHKMGSRRIK